MSASQHSAVVRQLRKMATTATKSGAVAEPAPHPDAELLKLCAEVIDLRAQADSIHREAVRTIPGRMDDPAFVAEIQKRQAAKSQCHLPMTRIPKIPAATPAGIYAKAFVLKLSYGAARGLALSIGVDLIHCPGLRSALWPADISDAAGD